MPDRKFLRITRYPGESAVLTINDVEHRIVRIKVTDDVMEVLYEETEDA